MATPRDEMAKEMLKQVAAKHPNLTLPQLMKISTTAAWDFDAHPVKCIVKIPPDDAEEEVLIEYAPADDLRRELGRS